MGAPFCQQFMKKKEPVYSQGIIKQTALMQQI